MIEAELHPRRPCSPSPLQRLLLLEEASTVPSPLSECAWLSPSSSSLFSAPLSVLSALPSFRHALSSTPGQRRHAPNNALSAAVVERALPASSIAWPPQSPPPPHASTAPSAQTPSPSTAASASSSASPRAFPPLARIPPGESGAAVAPSFAGAAVSACLPAPPLSPRVSPAGSSSAASSAPRAPLSLSALQALAADPAVLSAEPSPGALMDRFMGGVHRRYIVYSCLVCGKQSSDKSKHAKHERACKRRLRRRAEEAERDEERRQRQQAAAERRTHKQRAQQNEGVPARPQQRSQRSALVAPASSSHRRRKTAASSLGGAAGQSSTAVPRAVSASEMASLVQRELKALYHGCDCSLDTCLLSRDSVLTRIDLRAVFDAPGLWSRFAGAELSHLCALLPAPDQRTVANAQRQQRRFDGAHTALTGVDGEAATDATSASPRFSSQSALSHADSLPSSVPLSSALPTLSATVSTKAFGAALRDYAALLRTGSLDPELKGLRLMALSKRRKEARSPAPWKCAAVEPYWGEALSETKVRAQPLPGGGLKLGQPRKAASPFSHRRGAQKHSGSGGGTSRSAAPADDGSGSEGRSRDARSDNGRWLSPPRPAPLLHHPGRLHAARRRDDAQAAQRASGIRAPLESASDSEETQSDEANDLSADSESERASNDGFESREPSMSSVRMKAARIGSRSSPDGDRGPQPLHRRYRPSRGDSPSEDDDGSDDDDRLQSAPQQLRVTSSTHLPSSVARGGGSLPRLASLLPLPQPVPPVSAPLPSSYPIIQRFHFRSPRFRGVRRATFVLGAPVASAQGADRAKPDGGPRKKQRVDARGSRPSTAPPSSSSPAMFSHLPSAVAVECAELRRRAWSAEQKAAAQRRIDAAQSTRVRRSEQEKLNRALEAEKRLLALMEDGGQHHADGGRADEGSARRRLQGSREHKDAFAAQREAMVRAPRMVAVRQAADPAVAEKSAPAASSSPGADPFLSADTVSSAELQRHIFSPAPDCSEGGFSSFVLTAREGPHRKGD